MVNPLIEEWKYTTLLIENEWGMGGTGFFVRRPVGENKFQEFLVTNKHVINKDPEKRRNAKEITLYFNVIKNGAVSKGKVTMGIDAKGKDQVWREHPDKDTDVWVVHASSLINNIPEIKRKFAEYKFFADPKILNDYNITSGDEVAVIGYPLGMRHRLTNRPLIRKGLISTEIGESLEIFTEENGEIRNRIIRGFIIDGGTSPGSSGSPVVLYPNALHYNLDGSVGMGPPTTPYLLGIVSEARITNIEDKSGKPHLNLSGLSVVFDAETIKETIELFFN